MRILKKAAVATAAITAALTMTAAMPAGASTSDDAVSAAVTTEYDTAKKNNNPPSMDRCVGKTQWDSSGGCLKKYGDRLFAYDTTLDGFSVYVLWENQLYNGSGWKLYRKGRCTSNHGFDNYGECNKDFYENSTYPNAFGSSGSRIRIKSCADVTWGPDHCTEWSPWLVNDK